MACFLIDYENESGRILEGISLIGLTQNDEIVFFYSKIKSRLAKQEPNKTRFNLAICAQILR